MEDQMETSAFKILEMAEASFAGLEALELDERIEAINAIRLMLQKYSPFHAEPVDCVLWVKADEVMANDYNPNAVAPPEMKLLEHSIQEDGYTQPIVAWERDVDYEVVDGFHRHRVGKESEIVRERLNGYLPLAIINSSRSDKGDRIASTIRHNRARGKHKVEAMSDIVIELKRRNWSDVKIGKELGMDPDEVLRLCQITGLAELFTDHQFSKSWDIDGEKSKGKDFISDADEDKSLFSPDYEPEAGRILHTYDKWECYPAGFYEEQPPNGMTQEQGEEEYRKFLSDLPRFEKALKVVTAEWKHSCEHYLTNERMNRIAYLGQASVAQALKIPCCCRGGFSKLTKAQQDAADEMALKYLNKWLVKNDMKTVTMKEALGRTEAELY